MEPLKGSDRCAPTEPIPGYLQIPRDFLDRFALDEIFSRNPVDRLHYQHSRTSRLESTRAAHQANLLMGQFGTQIPHNGVKITLRNYIAECKSNSRHHWRGQNSSMKNRKRDECEEGLPGIQKFPCGLREILEEYFWLFKPWKMAGVCYYE